MFTIFVHILPNGDEHNRPWISSLDLANKTKTALYTAIPRRRPDVQDQDWHYNIMQIADARPSPRSPMQDRSLFFLILHLFSKFIFTLIYHLQVLQLRLAHRKRRILKVCLMSIV